MPLTFEEICYKLKQIDEISLLEVLDLCSEDIVDRFRDVIEDRLDELVEDLEEEQDPFNQDEI